MKLERMTKEWSRGPMGIADGVQWMNYVEGEMGQKVSHRRSYCFEINGLIATTLAGIPDGKPVISTVTF